MHKLRRNKGRSSGFYNQHGREEEKGSGSEPRRADGSSPTTDEKEESIVISDSDSLELEEEGGSQKKPAFHRKTLATKRKIARMTEEEQLALAVKISQQEQANHVKHRQEDEELFRKAIEQSLHSCKSPDKTTIVPVHDLTQRASSSEEEIASHEQQKEHLSQHSQISDQDSSQNPKVFLKRLSQDIVESSSVILSPNCRDRDFQSCKSPDKLTIVPVHDLPEETSSSEEDIVLDEQHRELFSHGSQNSSQSPKVFLKCLSQDIVESSSVILSPRWKDPSSCTASCKASLPRSNSGSPSKASLSPVIPIKASYSRYSLTPRKLFQGKNPHPVTDGHSSHCSESTQLDSSSLVSISNETEPTEVASSSQIGSVCLHGSSKRNTSVNDRGALSIRSCQSSADTFAKKTQNESNVHYYWGIPFCPNGVDPNAYTQVILCQLEVYEKCLKKSQRNLLHKTGYSEPIDLAASSESNRRAKNNQGNLSQEDTEEIMEGGDQENAQQSVMEPAEETDSSDTLPVPSKRSKASSIQEEDHSCPSEGKTKSQSHEPCTNMQPQECAGVSPEVCVESPISLTAVRDEICQNSELPISSSQEEGVCQETQLGLEIQDSDRENQPDLMETGPASSEECCLNDSPPDMALFGEPDFSSDVECPMCGCKFSQSQIEHHAAYCDGTKEEPPMQVLRPRNRQSRQTYNGSRDSASSSESGKLEKCYLCKSLFPIKEYQAHVDRCLQSATLEPQGTTRLKSSKETAEREGRLLSLLKQSEAISSGITSHERDENNGAVDFPSMSPPREDHTGDFTSSHLSVNDSPIRSFVSISEARDCLVDFKKQFSRPPKLQANRRGAKHRGKRRRRM